MPDLLERLLDYSRSRLGMTTYDQKDFRILHGSLDTYVRFHPDETPPVALLRVHNRQRTGLSKKYPGVCKSEKMRWKTRGWTWTDVPIDGSVPEGLLVQLIDLS
jgi:hypothetical protein